MVICLERDADLHMAQLMPLPLASVKSRLILPFWYRLIRVVLDKGPLNVCVCLCGVTVVTATDVACCDAGISAVRQLYLVVNMPLSEEVK